MKNIYIAGKVTGLTLIEVTQRFGQAQVELEAAGYRAINPLQIVNDWKCPWPLAMRKCIAALMSADAVLLLDNWSQSRGATVECSLAAQVGIPVFKSLKALKSGLPETDEQPYTVPYRNHHTVRLTDWGAMKHDSKINCNGHF